MPPWASKQLYTGAGGHSPDTAAQALYDEGRIADPTVDAFWEAVRGDIETVSLSKQREIEAIEAEAAQAVERALALHRATLADIEQRDAEGGLPLPGDVRREVTAATPLSYDRERLELTLNRAMQEGKGAIKKTAFITLSDVPDFWVRLGFHKGKVVTQAQMLRKLGKYHKLSASAIAELPSHYQSPVAVLKEEDGWIFLTDQLAENRDGNLAPVMIFVRQNARRNSYLVSAYSRDIATEKDYVEAAVKGGILFLDQTRLAALPLQPDIKSRLIELAGDRQKRGRPFDPQEGPNRPIKTSGGGDRAMGDSQATYSVANREWNVPQEAFDEARRRLEVAGLYYGRAPEAAELSDRAIAEFAVAEEALRTGKKPSQAQVSQAFADFGLHPGEQSGRSARRTLKLLNDLGLTYDKDGNAVAVPKGALSGLLSRNERLRGAFDSAWSEAEAEAFSKGAASAFAAARGMAAETQALAKAHRDEAEAVLGMDPGILQTELGFDLEATLLADKTKWQKLTPQQAEALAKILTEMADRLAYGPL